MKEKILDILRENRGSFVNGNEIAGKLNVSRMTVSKHIKSLKASGHQIEAVRNRGYRLVRERDSIDPEYISEQISDFYSGIEYFESLDSTNTYLKSNSQKQEGHIVISNRQQAGRGRSGRSFFSPQESGIYMSVLLKPKESVLNLLKLTSLTAVAVNSAIRELYPVDSRIKWVNDILIRNRKVCGILIEASLEMNTADIEYLVVGIGVNVHSREFPAELEQIAGSLEDYSDIILPRNELIIRILRNFERIYHDLNNPEHMQEYVRQSAVINQKIRYTVNNESSIGTVVDIDENGFLHIMDNDEIKIISSGEIEMI